MGASPVIVRHRELVCHGVAATWAGLRLAHISDLHVRRWDRTLQAAQQHLLTLDYDYLLVTGDFAIKPPRWSQAVPLLHRFFTPLARRATIHAVLGNHDTAPLAHAPEIPIHFLRDDSVTIVHNEVTVELAGVEQLTPNGGDLDRALRRPKSDLTMLLAHYPSTVYRLPPGRVDLQLSGHTHGGQIRVPYFGCLWTNDAIPRAMAYGLHKIDGVALHISAGIGVSPPILSRMNCPSEITVLTIKPCPKNKPGAASDRLITAGTA